MSAGQQQQLAGPLFSALRDKGLRLENQELAETWRLVASLERLSINEKRQLAEAALHELSRKKSEPLRPALLWAVGRLGSRVPVYGPLNTTVGRQEVEHWVAKLLRFGFQDKAMMTALAQLARKTGDRYRDLSQETCEAVVQQLDAFDAPASYVDLVRDGGTLTSEQETAVFGEALPLGIRLAR
jgi:hypothetical protein